ncbi:hypothetical protein SAMN05216301_2831 [Morganella morganii]|nr:hypothetical protein SAMN05216301_2831 [Morganella morganii]
MPVPVRQYLICVNPCNCTVFHRSILFYTDHRTRHTVSRNALIRFRARFVFPDQADKSWPHPGSPRTFPARAVVRCKPPDAEASRKSDTNSAQITECSGYWRVCRPAFPGSGMKWTARCSRHHSRCGRRSAPPDARVRPFFLRQIQTRLVRGNLFIRGIHHTQTALRAGNALNSLNVLFAAVLIIC